MKTLFSTPRFAPLVAALLLLHGFKVAAVTFTNDTVISFNNTNYDGLDIVVTNCTLTVDGIHAFTTVQVLNAGNLTHTYAPDGMLVNHSSFTNELRVLSTTNTATLSNTNVVVSSIVVRGLATQVTYASGVDYVIGANDGLTTLLLTTNSAIADGSTNLVSYDFLVAQVAAGLSLTVTRDVTVAQGGTINADKKGYGPGEGPGAGTSSGNPLSGSGGSHGGNGGTSAALNTNGVSYDSIQQPTLLGSGGGSGYAGEGGAGGGAIILVVGGTMRVDGSVTANGANAVYERAGGGSGGAIWLSATSFTGNGVISANGGAGEPAQGGGGGGGRVSLWSGTNGFSGVSVARGGGGYVYGGAGTIYTRVNSQPSGRVLVDNGGSVGASTPVLSSEAFDLAAQRGAMISLLASQSLGNLLMASNAWICFSGQTIPLVVTNATIEAGGGIIADGGGYAGGQGAGAGKVDSTAHTGGGGGYGGYGAMGGALSTNQSGTAYGGTPYGSVTGPAALGSSGGGDLARGTGGAGGGCVLLTVTGTLVLDGRISADGSPGIAGGSGGGSGGSISLAVGTLTGGGTISANGGMGNGFGSMGGGGGGGGRIAIKYGGYLFFGAKTARGGSGSAWGGAGTIYTKANNQPSGQVLVDNGGQAGTNTTCSTTGTVDLTVQGGAVVGSPIPQLGTLLVASNGWLRMTSQGFIYASSAIVQSGGGIIADSAGYPSGLGPGAGKYASGASGIVGGGAGYGGYGATTTPSVPTNLSPVVAYGGLTYGSVSAPNDLGSGGGGNTNTVIGGTGGGAINLNVPGVLQVYGTISASGGAGNSPSAGGGSGGSILLTVGTLAGSGVIAANGGAGNDWGGGGGGGRIAIIYGTYDFSGRVSAYGGGGCATAGAGTIYTKLNSQSALAQVLVDNGGQAGTNTTFGVATPGVVDLTVRNGAVLSPPPTQTIGMLMVATNGWVSILNQTLTVTGNAIVQAGGGIIADGTGSPAGQGQGAGRSEGYGNNSSVGGGGGYGGYGASGGVTPYAYGGATYGSATEPTAIGSGGGGPSSVYRLPMGGAGGGAIGLTVTGTLQVDGRISALGLAGSGPSTGGGSAGSIYLRVGTLTGSGVISANGGAGNFWGGGGGGGRVAIVYAANRFTGLMSAYGGAGYSAGGAGTIYMRPATLPAGSNPLIIVDNGGQAGTNTSWAGFGTADLTVRGGGVVASSISQTVGELVLASNGWVLLSVTNGTVPVLTISRDAIVQAGCGIIADGTGSPARQGQGAGRYVSTSSGYVGSGGGYGGSGGSSGGTQPVAGGTYYGSATTPNTPGSGGGASGYPYAGGEGGGGIFLNVAGTLRVDGRISAGGGAAIIPNLGGGSGGSIWLTAGTLAGGGVILANGGLGNGLGGGGGGGRIALQYSTNVFLGVLSAYGGSGYTPGGAGTIYSKANNQLPGQLLVDNGGQAGTNTSWTESGGMDLTVKGGAVIALPNSQAFSNLLVASNGWITPTRQLLTVTGNATVQAGGGIIADGTGYVSGLGPGAGKYTVSSTSGTVGGGGGYGGYGAAGGGAVPASGGSTYQRVTNPTDPGSGGGSGSQSSLAGGAGGGAVRMNVTGMLLVNGRVSANGGLGLTQGGGGGSGGSVWLTAGTLAGNGIISANGGSGNQLGGGGGGGCISLQYGANLFGGAITACGGGGYAWGGAGTIYTKANSAITGQMLVDNGGNSGTNTPLPSLSPFDLTVRGGAIVYLPPTNIFLPAPPLVLSNLFVNAGGCLTCLKTATYLDVAVLRNVRIDAGGVVTVDGLGFAAGTGPGAGLTTNSIGSGAGYGENGGASTVMPGGTTYGFVEQPVDRGSGGGLGYGTATNGSEGGGAIRLTVGGTLTLNGSITAKGNAALQDDGGGGSGGSVWLTAGALAGSGSIMADGGAGELYGGGGGGGGRIAIHTPFNSFGGVVSVAGGAGASLGQTGSIYYAATPVVPQVVSSTPVGSLTAAVSSAQIVFSTWLKSNSVSAANIGLTAPGGLAVNDLNVAALNPHIFQINFPPQTAQGDYTLVVRPPVQDIFGNPMSQVYTSVFSIVWAVVRGSITDPNGVPVPGVLLQPGGGVPATTTDTNGNYVLGVPLTGTIRVVPSKTGLMFVPHSLSYANVTKSISNQNYLAVSTVAPALTIQVQTNGIILSWYGIPGVTYQTLYSTDLVTWWWYGASIAGTNGPLQLLVPIGTEPSVFFRMGLFY
jgi:hypothetical protein